MASTIILKFDCVVHKEIDGVHEVKASNKLSIAHNEPIVQFNLHILDIY